MKTEILPLAKKMIYNPAGYIPGGICVKGNIYTRQTCHICGGKLQHIERKGGCFCDRHPKVAATRFYVRFETVFKNFSSYQAAAQFLNGLRYKKTEGSFDARDYQKDKPFGFKTLAEKYLKRKESLKSFSNVRNYINKAIEYWDQTNVKDISGADIEDFLFSIKGISEKTRHNYKSTLSDFWKWILRRGVITLAQMPGFPEIKYELAYRTITDFETQGLIIDEVKRISCVINPKIWFGIELLASYTSLRPDDLRRLKECDYDSKHQMLIIHHPTKARNKIKTVRLLEEHAEIWEGMASQFSGMPDLPFFRHHGNVSGTTAGEQFGPKYFRVWWQKACSNLGVKGLDLYGGTRHTTTTELARAVGSDGARKASGHETNKAFDRYCQVQDSSAFEMAKITHRLKKDNTPKVIPLNKTKK